MHKYKKAAILAAGAGTVYFFHKTRVAALEQHKQILNKSKINSEQPLLELTTIQRRHMPWEVNLEAPQKEEDWEMRKIKIRGAFFGHFHLVYRERNGKPGYMVFRGLKTAHAMGGSLDAAAGFRGLPVGMMVNLGWVSQDNVKHLENAEVNYITKIEHDTSLPGVVGQIQNKITGFVYNSEGDDFEHPIEDYGEEEVEISGYLRKGEQSNFWLGKRRYPGVSSTTYVDLQRMASLYQFTNIHSATHYYLEAATEGLTKDASKDNILIPASFNNPMESTRATTNKYLDRNYRRAEILTGVLTALGAFAL